MACPVIDDFPRGHRPPLRSSFSAQQTNQQTCFIASLADVRIHPKMAFSEEDLAAFKEVFGHYVTDKEKDTIPAADIGIIMRNLDKNPLESEIAEMLKQHGSETMDFASFLNFMETPLKQKSQPTEREILEAFRIFDDDNSGTIEKHDLRKIMCELGEGLDRKDFESMIEGTDPKGTGKIDYKALVEVMFAAM
eukprot:scaffold1667_cov173-Amphora_coffeaeformis.AAC.24